MGLEIGGQGYMPAGPRGPNYGPGGVAPGGTGTALPEPKYPGGIRTTGPGTDPPEPKYPGGPRITGPGPVAGTGGGRVPIGPPVYEPPTPAPTPTPVPAPDPGRLPPIELPGDVYTINPQPEQPVRPQRSFVGGYATPSGGGTPITPPSGGYTPGPGLGSYPGPSRGPTGKGSNQVAGGRYLPPPGVRPKPVADVRPQPTSDVYRRKDVLR